MRRLALALSSILLACSDSGLPMALPLGTWGGEHISLTVHEAGGTVELDCAHGTVDEPLLLDSEGRFTASGFYVPEQGGPVRDDEPEVRRPASYSGRLEDSRLILSIRVTDDGALIGPFAAQRGRSPLLFKCL